MTLLANVLRQSINLVLPAHCVGCRYGGTYLCTSCLAATDPLYPATVASESIDGFDSTTSAFAYEGVVRTAVHHLKFRNLRAIASPMAQAMATTAGHPLEVDAVVPVPLHRSRLRERGYNQAQLLAAHFARLLQLPLEPRWLARTRQAGRQVEARSVAARRENVRNAFEASPAVSRHRIALIDDVMTTGATLHAAAAALKAQGAESVHCFTFAREE